MLKKLIFFIYRSSISQLKFQLPKDLHTSQRTCFLNVRDPAVEKKSVEVTVVHGTFFDQQKEKSKKAFYAAVQVYIEKNNIHRRGHVEFLYAALSRVDKFMAHRDIETYRRLLEVFPRFKMIPQNVWQEEFMHYPKQQQCCIDILDYMESHGVIPDDDFGYQLLDIFGNNSHVFRKYRRMMYWMPKFKYANPYYVPYDLPDDLSKLAELVLRRMSPDLNTHVTHFKTDDLKEAFDKTFVVSAQSPLQQELLAREAAKGALQGGRHLVVEGGFRAWARTASLTYFVLKSETGSLAGGAGNDDEVCEWKMSRDHEKPSLYTFNDQRNTTGVEGGSVSSSGSGADNDAGALVKRRSVHEQDDGVVLAMAVTGTSSKDSLVSWIKLLETTNPCLSTTPILFQLTHSTTDSALQTITHNHLPDVKQ